jgi:hypothetical protein
MRRRNEKRCGHVADALCEVCAMRKIVLLQSNLSDVANLLRCVLHGTAMQKRAALVHATIWNRFPNRTDASFDALAREDVSNHLLHFKIKPASYFFARMLDSMALRALS